MSFAVALARAERACDDAAALADLAHAALEAQEEERALALLAPAAARRRGDARLWQWTALLYRALDRNDEALSTFETAAQLAPVDAGIAHGRARVALEAGFSAVDLFDAALKLAPDSAEIFQGRAAALFAEGKGRAAIDELAAILVRRPDWIEGHATAAQLRTLLDGRGAALLSFDAALAAMPHHAPLWQAAIETLVRGERFGDALDYTRRARSHLGADPYFDLHEALALSEQGETEAAEPLFAAIAHIDAPVITLWHVRHLIRTAQLEQAARRIEPRLDPADPTLWPYAATVWRATNDPRFEWLEGDTRLVSTIDLADRLPPLDRLAVVLRGLHRAHGEHLDQSVRGGTQTDGPLFARDDPEIRALRSAVSTAVERHIAQLPPPDPRHPTLSKRRDRRPRFAGSWSVRLRGQGHHANHVHPQGWLSSALYIALPRDAERGEGEAGWLTLGQPQRALGVDLPPTRRIEPRPGRLVLFPSTTWHGTVPFDTGERLTVAFDIAPPL